MNVLYFFRILFASQVLHQYFASFNQVQRFEILQKYYKKHELGYIKEGINRCFEWKFLTRGRLAACIQSLFEECLFSSTVSRRTVTSKLICGKYETNYKRVHCEYICEWRFSVPKNFRLELRIFSFHIDSYAEHCIWGKAQITGTVDSITFCGTKPEITLTTILNEVSIIIWQIAFTFNIMFTIEAVSIDQELVFKVPDLPPIKTRNTLTMQRKIQNWWSPSNIPLYLTAPKMKMYTLHLVAYHDEVIYITAANIVGIEVWFVDGPHASLGMTRLKAPLVSTTHQCRLVVFGDITQLPKDIFMKKSYKNRMCFLPIRNVKLELITQSLLALSQSHITYTHIYNPTTKFISVSEETQYAMLPAQCSDKQNNETQSCVYKLLSSSGFVRFSLLGIFMWAMQGEWCEYGGIFYTPLTLRKNWCVPIKICSLKNLASSDLIGDNDPKLYYATITFNMYKGLSTITGRVNVSLSREKYAFLDYPFQYNFHHRNPFWEVNDVYIDRKERYLGTLHTINLNLNRDNNITLLNIYFTNIQHALRVDTQRMRRIAEVGTIICKGTFPCKQQDNAVYEISVTFRIAKIKSAKNILNMIEKSIKIYRSIGINMLPNEDGGTCLLVRYSVEDTQFYTIFKSHHTCAGQALFVPQGVLTMVSVHIQIRSNISDQREHNFFGLTWREILNPQKPDCIHRSMYTVNDILNTTIKRRRNMYIEIKKNNCTLPCFTVDLSLATQPLPDANARRVRKPFVLTGVLNDISVCKNELKLQIKLLSSLRIYLRFEVKATKCHVCDLTALVKYICTAAVEIKFIDEETTFTNEELKMHSTSEFKQIDETWYRIIKPKVVNSWNDAEAICQEFGGHLMSFPSLLWVFTFDILQDHYETHLFELVYEGLHRSRYLYIGMRYDLVCICHLLYQSFHILNTLY